MSSVFADIIDVIPFNFLRHFAQVDPLIANYHMISDQNLPHVKHLYKYRDVKTFIDDMDFFSKHFNLISLPELLEYKRTNQKIPKNSFHLTFDDGFRELYDIAAPILQERKISATIFVTKNYLDNVELGYDNKKSLLVERLTKYKDPSMEKEISSLMQKYNLSGQSLISSILNIPYGRRHLIDQIGNLLHVDFNEFLSVNQPYLTTSQVISLINEGICIGGHSIDHPRFTELTPEERQNQALSSVDYVYEKFGLKYRVFAFPYSDKEMPVDFFDSVYGKLDATFGNQGMIGDTVKMNIQRITIEKLDLTCSKALKYQYIKKLLNQTLNKNLLIRS